MPPIMNTSSNALPTSPKASIWPSPLRASVSVFVLMAAYAIAFVDRQIITLLVEPISQDLGITDTEFSLLSGLAFTLFYTFMGIPLAWAADRWSRRNLIMLGIGVWSAMTAACGMASSFLTLFLARIGVGIGEAGLSPAAYLLVGNIIAFTIGPTAVALISDYWLKDPAKIGIAVAIVSAVAIPLGIVALAAARKPYMRLIEAAEKVET